MRYRFSIGKHGRTALTGELTLTSGATEYDAREAIITAEQNAGRVGLTVRFEHIPDPPPAPAAPAAEEKPVKKESKPKKEKKAAAPKAKKETKKSAKGKSGKKQKDLAL